MGIHSPLIHQLRESLEQLSSVDASDLQQQAKTLFKQQLHAGFAARIAPDFQQHEINKLLLQLDDTLEESGLISQFAHNVGCGSTYTARVVLEQSIAALQDSSAAEKASLLLDKETAHQDAALSLVAAHTTAASEPHYMCSRLACELQQLVKKYQQAGEQLTAVGKQLRQARSSLKTMETQLEGPPLHVHHSRVAQACQHLKGVTERLKQLQVGTGACSTSSTCNGGDERGSGVSHALQGIQQILDCRQGAVTSADIINEVLSAWHSCSSLQQQMGAAVTTCAARLPVVAFDLAVATEIPQLQQVVGLLKDSASRLQQLSQQHLHSAAACSRVEDLLQQLAGTMTVRTNAHDPSSLPSNCPTSAGGNAPQGNSTSTTVGQAAGDCSACNQLATAGSVGQPSTPSKRCGSANGSSRGPSRLARASVVHSEHTAASHISGSSSSSWQQQSQHAAQLASIVSSLAQLAVPAVVSDEDFEERDEVASPTHASLQPEPPSRLEVQSVPASSRRLSAVAAQQQQLLNSTRHNSILSSAEADVIASATDSSHAVPKTPGALHYSLSPADCVEKIQPGADCKQLPGDDASTFVACQGDMTVQVVEQPDEPQEGDPTCIGCPGTDDSTAEAAQHSEEEHSLARCGSLSLPSFGDTAGLDEEDSGTLLLHGNSEGSAACCTALVQQMEQEQEQQQQTQGYTLLAGALAVADGSINAARSVFNNQLQEHGQVEPLSLLLAAGHILDSSVLHGGHRASDPGGGARGCPARSPSYLQSLNTALQADSKHMRQQVEAIQQQLLAALKQLDDSNAAKAEQQQQLVLQQQQVEELQQQLACSVAHHTELQQQLRFQQQELDAQLRQVGQLKELQELLAQKQQQVDMLQQQLIDLQKSLLDAQEQQALKEKEVISCKQQIQQLQRQLSETIAAQQQQEHQQLHLEAQVQQLQQISALDQQLVTTQQDITQLAQMKEKQQAVLSQAQLPIHNEQQVVQLRLQVDLLQQQLCDALNEAAVLKMEQQLQQQELKSHLSKLQQVEQLQQQLAGAHAEVVQLAMQQQQQDASAGEQNQQQQNVQETEQLRQQVLELQQQLASALANAAAVKQQQEQYQQEQQTQLGKLQDTHQLQQQLADGEAEIAQHAGQHQIVESVEEQVDQLQQQLHHLQQELATALADAATTRKEQEEQQKQLQIHLDKLQQERQQLQQQLEAAQEEAAHLTQEQQARQHSSSTELSKQQQLIQHLQQQLVDAKAAAVEATQQQEQQSGQHMDLVADLQQQLQEALASAASSSQQRLQQEVVLGIKLQELQQIEELQQQLVDAHKELAHQAARQTAAWHTLHHAVDTVQAAAAASATHQHTSVDMLNQRVQDLQEQVKVARGETTALQQQLLLAQQAHNNSLQQIRQLQQQLADAKLSLDENRQKDQKELDNLQLHAQQLQSELHSAQGHVARFKQQLQEHTQVLTQQQADQLQKQLADAHADIAELLQQKQSLQQQLATALDQKQAQHELLLQQLAETQSSLARHTAQQQQVDDLQQQLADALADAATLRTAHAQQQAEFEVQLQKLQAIEQLHVQFAAAQHEVADLAQQKSARQQHLEEQLSHQQQQIAALQQQLLVANAEVSLVAEEEQRSALALVVMADNTPSSREPAAQQTALVVAKSEAAETTAGAVGSSSSSRSSAKNMRKLSVALTEAYMELAVRDQHLNELWHWMDILLGGVSQVRQALDCGCAGNSRSCAGERSRSRSGTANTAKHMQEVTIGGAISSSLEATADAVSCSELPIALATSEATVAADVSPDDPVVAGHTPAVDHFKDHMSLLVELQSLANEVKVLCCERQLLQEAVQQQLQAIAKLEGSLAALKQQQESAQTAAEKQHHQELLQAAAASVAAQQLAALVQQLQSDMPAPSMLQQKLGHDQGPKQQHQQQLLLQDGVHAADEQQQTRRQLLWSQESAMSAVALAAELSGLSSTDTQASEASTVKENLIQQLADEVQQLWSAHARAEQLQSQLAAAEELNASLKCDMVSIAAKLTKLQGGVEASTDVRKRRKAQKPASSTGSTADSALAHKQSRGSSRVELIQELAAQEKQIKELLKQRDQLQAEVATAEQVRQQLAALQLEHGTLQQHLQAASASAGTGSGMHAAVCASLGRPVDGVWGSDKGLIDQEQHPHCWQSVKQLQQQVAELQIALQAAQQETAAGKQTAAGGGEQTAAADVIAECTIQQLQQQIVELQGVVAAAKREAAAHQAAAQEASQKAAAATAMAAAADTAVASTIQELQQQLEQVTAHLASITQQQQQKLSSRDAAEAAANAAAEVKQLRSDKADLMQLVDQQKQQLQEQGMLLHSSRLEVQQLKHDISARLQQLADQQVLIGQLRGNVLQLHQQLAAILQLQHQDSQPPALATFNSPVALSISGSTACQQERHANCEDMAIQQQQIMAGVNMAPGERSGAVMSAATNRDVVVGSDSQLGVLGGSAQVDDVRIGAAHARTEELRQLYRDLASKDAHIQRLETRAKAKVMAGALPAVQH